MAKQKVDVSSEEQSNAFKGGDLVLVKYLHYEPWPSMIIPWELTNREIRKAKKNKDEICFKFFGENSNGVALPKKIKYLSKADVDSYFNEKGELLQNKKSDIKAALKEIKEFYHNPEDIATKTKRRLEVGDDVTEAVLFGSPYPEIKEKEMPALKKAKSNKSNKPDKRILEDDDKTNEDDTKNKKAKKINTGELTEEEKIAKVQFFRSKLQRGLLQRKDFPSPEELKTCSDILEELEEFSGYITIDLLKVSKLHKLLRAIFKFDQLKNPEGYNFHKRAEDLLVKWESLIHEIKSKKEKSSDSSNGNGIKVEKNDETNETKKEEPDKTDVGSEES